MHDQNAKEFLKRRMECRGMVRKTWLPEMFGDLSITPTFMIHPVTHRPLLAAVAARPSAAASPSTVSPAVEGRK